MVIKTIYKLLAGAIIGTAGGGSYWLTRKDKDGTSNYNKVKKHFKNNKLKLGVIGMTGAGKTRFLSHLRNIPYEDKQTMKESYDAFVFEFEDKKVKVVSGQDIGGSEYYVDDYKEIIKKSDFVFYFFDISKYIDSNEIKYNRYCDARLELIHSLKNDLNIKRNNFIIVGSHLDKCNKTEFDVSVEFNKMVRNKSYYNLLKNIRLIDLTNSSQVNSFFKNIVT